jgi:nitroreductase
MNVQEIALYVFLAEGVYRFEAKSHSLQPVLAGDHRDQAGTQSGVARAPLGLIYVADLARYGEASSLATQLAWSNAHCGFIAQNVYLFAASEGLASWFRAYVDAPALSALLKLKPTQKVLYGQSVGYPARSAG